MGLCWGCSSRGVLGSVNKSAGPKRCGSMSASPYDSLWLPKKKRMLSCMIPTACQSVMGQVNVIQQEALDAFSMSSVHAGIGSDSC